MSDNYQDFYKNLNAFHSLRAIGKSSAYQSFPDEWYIVITDVIKSTEAINSGKYKEVNIAGVLALIAVSNFFKNIEFPFVFGGDGVTFFIPENAVDDVKDILADTCLVVKNNYELNLRVGLLRISEIYNEGFKVSVSKVKVSDHYNQAIIGGDGSEYAEKIMKDPETSSGYLIESTYVFKTSADFSGFMCRWQDVPGIKGETLALIVKIRSRDEKKQMGLLLQIYDKISDLLDGEENYHPLSIDTLKMSYADDYLKNETRIHANANKGFKYSFFLLKLKMQTFMIKMIIKIKLNTNLMGIDIKNLKKSLVLSSDYRKFDGSLKMIISILESNRLLLQKYLEDLYLNNQIFYGTFVSDRALLTCFMHTNTDQEVHFIDAADGGYAMAATQMKSQIKRADAGKSGV